MSSRGRIRGFGTAGLLVLAGGICAAVVHGLIGQLLTIVLISVGLGAVVLLLFLEVGLSEDRERARDEERRRGQDSRPAAGKPRPRSTPLRWPRRPG